MVPSSLRERGKEPATEKGCPYPQLPTWLCGVYEDLLSTQISGVHQKGERSNTLLLLSAGRFAQREMCLVCACSMSAAVAKALSVPVPR